MEINDFLGISLVGVALSLVVEWGKKKYGTDSSKTRAITLALSLALGAGYWLLRETNLWQTALGILGAASTVYNFVLKAREPAE